MPELLGGFKTLDGEQLLKKRDANGQTYYVHKGEGQVSQQKYNGFKSRFQFATTGENGKILPSLQDSTSLDELEDKTSVPFDLPATPTQEQYNELSETFQNRIDEADRFRGFYESGLEAGRYDETDESELEAAKDYLQFRADIDEADTRAERYRLRKKYIGIGY